MRKEKKVKEATFVIDTHVSRFAATTNTDERLIRGNNVCGRYQNTRSAVLILLTIADSMNRDSRRNAIELRVHRANESRRIDKELLKEELDFCQLRRMQVVVH